MTCVVGLVDGGRVYVGGDSAGVDDYLGLEVRVDEKVFKKGEFVMGFTTSFRMGQLLRYKLEIPYHKPEMDTYEYMVSEFVEAVRKCMKDYGFAKITDGKEEGGTFLVGYRGELFVIYDDYQVARPVQMFTAVGCGHEIAKGSLYSTRNWADPVKRITEALEASEQFSAGVRKPFHIVHT